MSRSYPNTDVWRVKLSLQTILPTSFYSSTFWIAYKRWLRLTIFIPLLFVAGLCTWCVINPVRVAYRNYVEVEVGGTKIDLFWMYKHFTVLSNSNVRFTFGSLENGSPGPLPEYLEVINAGSAHWFDLNSPNQVNYIMINASPEISPGEYHLYARLEVSGVRIAELPFTVVVRESGDDIVRTPQGPAYRAEVHPPGEEMWPAINEKTVLLGPKNIPFTYRDTVDLKVGGYEGVLVNIATAGTELENRHIKFTVGEMRDGQVKTILSNFQIQSIETYADSRDKESLTLIELSSTWEQAWTYSCDLGIQVEVEGIGEIGVLPLTVNVVPSADDMLLTPVELYVYRAGIQGSAETPFSGNFTPIEQKIISIPGINLRLNFKSGGMER